MFVFAAAFYLWRATYGEPMELHGGQASQYNQLADAFLHLRLWLVHVPDAALGPGNPYDPAQRSAFLFNYPDYSLYGHHLYITWGPAPVLILLVPLHLLGFEPSGSVISTPFAVVGLGFALMTLRVILRQIGDVRLWMCIVAASTLSSASLIPFILRFPLVYHEEIAGAYCFTMAGIFLIVTTVVTRQASPKRLLLMSLCLGLATGSRPMLALLALLLIPVYKALRSTRPSRGLLVSLLGPFGVCVLLLLAYNQARFGSPFEYGARYQINGPSTFNAHFGQLGYLAPGLWAYLLAPPRLSAIFPFLQIVYPQISYPFSLPAHYAPLSEETGGLLPMAPIAIFLAAMPWWWRRRPALLSPLGPLAPLLFIMAMVAVGCMLFVAYEIYISTERYEADYMTLLLFGALAVWLALSSSSQGRGRRLVRVGGGALAVWSCVTGLAISGLELEKIPSTWRTAVSLGSPLSTAIATVAGRPVLAEVHVGNILAVSPPSYSIGTSITGFSLSTSNAAYLTIVSPDTRDAALLTTVSAGPALEGGTLPAANIHNLGHARYSYQLPAGGGGARIPLHLTRGINQIVLSLNGSTESDVGALTPEPPAQAQVAFSQLSLAAR